MKISKALLKSIALGVALGTLGTSCSSGIFTPILEDDVEIDADGNKIDSTETESQTNPDTCEGDWDCPACGLG